MDKRPHTGTKPAPAPKWRRLAWFVALWIASVLALAIVASLIKLALK